MVIQVYSLPALVALLTKLVIAYRAQASKKRNYQTALFKLALLAAATMTVGELLVLQHIDIYVGTVIYLAVAPLFIALLVHLAASVSFEGWTSRRAWPVFGVFYSIAGCLAIVVAFTKLIVVSVVPFRGYSAVHIPGPLYGLYELFTLVGMLSLVILPLFGARFAAHPVRRSQRKLWLIATLPLTALVVAATVLLHFGIELFNMTVTGPLLILLLLVAIGYVFYREPIIEIESFIPTSPVAAKKRQMHLRLARLSEQVSGLQTVEELINLISDAFRTSAVLVSRDEVIASSGGGGRIEEFPRQALKDIKGLTVAWRTKHANPNLNKALEAFGVGGIVPFFPYSCAGAWLLLGKRFDEDIYATADFKMASLLFDRIAHTLLDKIIARNIVAKANPAAANDQAARRSNVDNESFIYGEQPESLSDQVAALEVKLIEKALAATGGNQAKAAEMLGLRATTLHYKIRRYNLRRKAPRPY